MNAREKEVEARERATVDPAAARGTRAVPAGVSFIIPVRDDAARLERCLASIAALRTGGVPVEIIVADNASADDSAAVAARMGARVLHLPGLSVAQLRNRAAAEAAGELIAFVDADHVLDPEWLAAALDAMAEEGVSAAGSPYVSPSATWVQRACDRLRRPVPGRRNAEWLGSGNLIVRRALFLRAGGFDESLETCEDVDLCRRLRLAGLRLICEPGMRSVHLGDPTTLRALFYGELWRGRDNLRVTLRPPLSFRSLAGLALSAGMLACTAGALIGLPGLFLYSASPIVLEICIAGVLAVILLRAVRMTSAGQGLRSFLENIAFGAVYEWARAFALVARVSHRARRSPR